MTVTDLQKLLRPHIAGIKPYSSARDEFSGSASIFLDANENPYGSVAGGHYNRYPDPYQMAIKEKLSAYLGAVGVRQIFLGNGSDEAIDLLFRAYCEPGTDNVIITPPTYGMYEVSAGINNVECRKVNLTADFQLKTDAILNASDEHSKLIFLCSPNNPSGNDLKADDIETILKNAPGLVVVDEAYIDFAGRESYVKSLAKYPNLVVMQTFSKAWGLAALRLGMAFASEEIISVLNKIKPPYNINGLTQDKVLEAFEKISQKDQMVKDILTEREYLCEKLSGLKEIQKIYPSDANFVLVKINKAREVYSTLVEKGIIVRDRSKVQLCEDCLRITVGTREENDALVKELGQI